MCTKFNICFFNLQLASIKCHIKIRYSILWLLDFDWFVVKLILSKSFKQTLQPFLSLSYKLTQSFLHMVWLIFFHCDIPNLCMWLNPSSSTMVNGFSGISTQLATNSLIFSISNFALVKTRMTQSVHRGSTGWKNLCCCLWKSNHRTQLFKCRERWVVLPIPVMTSLILQWVHSAFLVPLGNRTSLNSFHTTDVLPLFFLANGLTTTSSLPPIAVVSSVSWGCWTMLKPLVWLSTSCGLVVKLGLELNVIYIAKF